MNKYHQFLLACLSIGLVFAMSLATVSKTIHDIICDLDCYPSSHQISSSCTGYHEGECNNDESEQQGDEHESAHCPVALFSNGLLILDSVPKINPSPTLNFETFSVQFISHYTKKEKKSHHVRGPPIISRYQIHLA